MKTGNKTQAMILSVVALLAVVFLVYQLMPGKTKPFAASASPDISVAQNTSASQDLSLAVLGNPFSHPKLATKVVSPPVAKQPPSQIDKSGKISPVTPSGWPGATSESPDGKTPAENAGKDRLEIQGPRIKLTAIMRVGEPVAMLAVNDQPGKAFGEGDLLAPKAWLVKIGDSSVTVRINGKEHEIATGDSYGAPKDTTK